ncbi:unnamed protein product [Macrosiphum euphorbiae]|uniref:Uncharacterized protein n=1 Tax=Macrosiphum euphorbiae TaxID=13131 RepID=A0AAV0WSS4_9HEMI|nr:unnamed protein product [Macrosiphum euphorbiae]
MEKELPNVPNIENDDSEHYKLIRVQPETTNKKFKLIIVGHSNVGKTTIINHFCSGVYQDTIPTTGIDFQEIFVRFGNETIHLNIGIAGGTEKQRSLAHSYYSGAHGVFIVYDITDLNSSFELDGWIKDVENFSDTDAVKILIGNKCDDIINREISIEEGREIAEVYGISFFEVSSKSNINIDKLLYTMISDCIKKELKDINVTNKPNTIPMQCPIIENELPDTTDTPYYKIIKIKPETTVQKYKLVIVGHSNVGKSSLIHRLCKGVYSDNMSDTSGMDFHKIFVSLKNKAIEINIWDTAGTEKFRSLSQQYCRRAHGIFIVYDITNLSSSFKLDSWIKDVENYSDLNAVKILIGSKCDDKSNRAISIEEGQKIAEQFRIPFFEVSSKTNVNIEKLFYTMISKIYTSEQTKNEDLLKLLKDINVTNKPNTIPMQCPIIENELPDTTDTPYYKIIKIKPETTVQKYKLIIVGHSNVGKSSLIHRLCKGVYSDNMSDTSGMDFHKIFVSLKNKAIEINIWDTAGTEKFRSLSQQYYRGAHGIFIVYDITNLSSSFKLDSWIKDVENYSDLNAVKILIGSKCDDKSNRAISIEEGQKIAEQFRIPFFEVSSKTNVNIEKLFYTMISKIYTSEQTKNEDLLKLVDSPTPQESPGGCSC